MSEMSEKVKSGLRCGIIRFVYIKHDGTRRVAYGTMLKSAVDKWKREKGREKCPYVKRSRPTTSYYDLVSDGFRCFFDDKVVDVDTIPVYYGSNDDTFLSMRCWLQNNKPEVFLSTTKDSLMDKCEPVEDTKVVKETTDKDEEQAEKPIITSKKDKSSVLRRLLNKYPVPTIETGGFYVTDFTWRSMLSNIYNKVNTLMVGPAGTGKTEICRFICKKMGLNYSHYNIGTMTDVQASLIGSHVIDSEGHSQFMYAQFVEDIQKPGIVMLDELNRNPQALNVLTNVLDGIRELNISGTGSSDAKRVKVHPSCVFFATANLGASYTGTSMIDEALETRFDFIGVDYIPDVYEAELLVKRTGVDAGNAKTIANIAKQIRQLYAKEEISKSVSTRETLRIAQKVAIGNTLRDALLNMLERFDGTNSEGERGIIYKIISGI